MHSGSGASEEDFFFLNHRMMSLLGETGNRYIVFLPFPLHLTYVAAEGSPQMIYSISSLQCCRYTIPALTCLFFPSSP